jgi:hypothetical protein
MRRASCNLHRSRFNFAHETGRSLEAPRRAPRDLSDSDSLAVCRSFDYWIPEPRGARRRKRKFPARVSVRYRLSLIDQPTFIARREEPARLTGVKGGIYEAHRLSEPRVQRTGDHDGIAALRPARELESLPPAH